jgi:hypothetical protein
MNSLPLPIPLHRSAWRVALDPVVFAWHRLQSAWTVHRAQETTLALERELAHLDPRTLQDIGAPQGLVGQRRWQEEQERHQGDRLLDLRGW